MEIPMSHRLPITLTAIFATTAAFAVPNFSGPARAQKGSYTVDSPPSMEAYRPFPRACAEPDLRAIALIEAHGEAWDLPPVVLGQAGLAQLDARLACLAGRIDEGLLHYGEVFRIGPVGPKDTE
jgi:hypothetical protein